MLFMKNIIVIMFIGVMMTACGHHTYIKEEAPAAIGYPTRVYIGKDNQNSNGDTSIQRISGSNVAHYPYATAFKMSGDYEDNVAIGMNNNGQLTYFPAPSDISDNSVPIDLGNGWWLNRQGIGPDAIFTKFTFKEYSDLRQVPTISELKESIIPGARVTRMVQLPYHIGEASSHIEEIKEYLNSL